MSLKDPFTIEEHLHLAIEGAEIAKHFVRLGARADARESLGYATWHMEQVYGKQRPVE